MSWITLKWWLHLSTKAILSPLTPFFCQSGSSPPVMAGMIRPDNPTISSTKKTKNDIATSTEHTMSIISIDGRLYSTWLNRYAYFRQNLQFLSICIDCFTLKISDNYHAATDVGMLGRGIGRIFIMGAKHNRGRGLGPSPEKFEIELSISSVLAYGAPFVPKIT